MTSPSSQFASLIRAGGHERSRIAAILAGSETTYNLYCGVCQKERLHTVKRGQVWTTIACACGETHDWRKDAK